MTVEFIERHLIVRRVQMVAPQTPQQSLLARGWRSPGARICASAVLVSVLAFAWTLDGYFLSEDFANVVRFLTYPLMSWPRLFVADWSGGMWEMQLPELRPMIALSFIIDSKIWGAEPFGYRLTNVLVHAVCAAMVGLIARRATGLDQTCGVVAAILFALHPVHAYAVTPICGRGDLIVSAFYLAGFLAFLRYRERADGRWLAGFALSYALAAFSKEYGFTLAFLLLVADVTWLRRLSTWRHRATWAPYVCCLIVAAIYFYCRHFAFGQSTAGAREIAVSDMGIWARLVRYQAGYVSQLFPPGGEWLRVWRDHGFSMQPWVPLQLALTLLACAALAYGVWHNRRRIVKADAPGAGLLFCIGWHVVATGPLFLTYFAPRHLYLASAGLCFAIVIVLRRALRSALPFRVTALAIIALYGLQLGLALRPWQQAAAVSRLALDEFARAAREAAPGSAIVIDVPKEIDVAVCWAWAVPFATQSPFIRQPERHETVVIAAPDTFAFPGRWQPEAIAAVGRIDSESWIIEITAAGEVRRRKVQAEKFQVAATQLVADSSPAAALAAWRNFIAELNGP